MTQFKTFFSVLYKYKGTVILYTVMLIVFGVINMSTNDVNTTFTSEKPDVTIINEDDSLISSNLVNYLDEVSNFKYLSIDKIDDALFYRDVNYVIYIPDGYGDAILNGENLELDIKSTGDYQAFLAESLLTRYLRVQSVYSEEAKQSDELIKSINDNLENKSVVNVKSKLDISSLENASGYYSFASYSIMAVIIYVICLVISSFNDKNVYKRTLVSSKSIHSYNFLLLLSSSLYALFVCFFFNILGVFLLGDVMFTSRGLMYILNSFVFTFVSLTIALLISTIVNSKEAVSGIVNVIALGSAFLCGAFVPSSMLPDGVLKFAHILPSYWYINSNDLLKNAQVIDNATLKLIIINMAVMLVFGVFFIILNNIISRWKRQSV